VGGWGSDGSASHVLSYRVASKTHTGGCLAVPPLPPTHRRSSRGSAQSGACCGLPPPSAKKKRRPTLSYPQQMDEERCTIVASRMCTKLQADKTLPRCRLVIQSHAALDSGEPGYPGTSNTPAAVASAAGGCAPAPAQQPEHRMDGSRERLNLSQQSKRASHALKGTVQA